MTEGRLSSKFGECRCFRIFDTDRSGVKSRDVDVPENVEAGELPAWLAEHQVTDIITRRIGKSLISLLAQQKINVWVGAPDEAPEILIRDCLDGTLVSDEKAFNED